MNTWLASMSMLLATCGAAASPAVTIELRPQVQAQAGPVRLGQVARLTSPDLSLLRRLVDLPLGRAPAAGDSAVLEREMLAGSLQRRLGLAAGQVDWQGAASSRVSASSRRVAGEDVAAAATQALQQWVASRAVRSEVELLDTPRDVEVGEGALELRPRLLGAMPLRRRMTVWVELWIAGHFARVVPVTFGVSAWGDGAIASLSLVRGNAMTPEVAQRGEVDLTTGTSPRQVDLVGLRARRPIAAGVPIRQQDVEAVPAVLRGEWAALRSGSGAVHTEARVQVLQDGHVGDNVRVRPSTAAASLLARVTGAGQLEVAR